MVSSLVLSDSVGHINLCCDVIAEARYLVPPNSGTDF